MSSWLQHVGRWFGSRPEQAGARVRSDGRPSEAPGTEARSSRPIPPGAARAALTRPEPVASILPDLRLSFFGWLLDTTPAHRPLSANEKGLLRHLDTVSAADGLRAGLLPRAAGVLPRLMSALRDADASSTALAGRVARDPTLIAEVLRLANAATTRGGEPVTGLRDAIGRIGLQGLKRAITTALLRPVFEAPADSLSGRAAGRLWLHSEAKADEALQLAAAAGIDPFDGYLAGLLHNVGWSAALRAIDRFPGPALDDFSATFVEELELRRETLFALLAMSWQLSDPLTALAVELLGVRLADADSPLAMTLRAADRHAAFEVLGAGALVEPIGR